MDIQAMEGRECSSATHYSPAFLTAYLSAMRASLAKTIGTPLRGIRITGVQTRDVTSTQGEAEVQYDLASSKVGNDNWVTYQVQGGRWKESSCQAPIGGETQSVRGTSG